MRIHAISKTVTNAYNAEPLSGVSIIARQLWIGPPSTNAGAVWIGAKDECVAGSLGVELDPLQNDGFALPDLVVQNGGVDLHDIYVDALNAGDVITGIYWTDD